MNDEWAVVGAQHSDLDQVDGPVGPEEQGDIVVVWIIGSGDDVTEGMADVVGANTVGAGRYR